MPTPEMDDGWMLFKRSVIDGEPRFAAMPFLDQLHTAYMAGWGAAAVLHGVQESNVLDDVLRSGGAEDERQGR